MPIVKPSPTGFHGAFRQSMSWFHTWLGLLLGVVLYFMFVTGTTGYAHYEITRWMTPELGKVTDTTAFPHDAETMFEAALAIAQERMPGSPAIYLAVPTDPNSREGNSSTLYAEPPAPSEGQEAAEALELKLDPNTLTERGAGGTPVRETAGGDTLYAMHYNLHYIPFHSLTVFGVTLPAWPTLIVGIATMFMLVAIVTGIVVHKKIFADFFTFRPGKGQRSWLDAHNLSSVLALPFMLMITYSGLIMYTYDYMPTVKTLAYGLEPDSHKVDCELYAYGCAKRNASGEAAPLADLGPLLALAEARWPGTPIKWVDVYNAGDKAATVDVWPSGGSLGEGYPVMSFDGVTGEVLHIQEPGGRGVVNATGAVMLELHEGTFAGPMLRWLYLVTGAIGAAMVASGLILWSVKRRQKLRATDRADLGLAFVERTNVAIVVGLLIAVVAYFWANRLLPLGLEGRADWEVNVMFIVWGMTFIHAAFRPARNGYLEQLALLVTGLALLPFLNAWTTDIHLGQTLFVPADQRDWVLASFDLTMLVLAAGFAFAFWHVRRKPARAERPNRVAAEPRAQPAE